MNKNAMHRIAAISLVTVFLVGGCSLSSIREKPKDIKIVKAGMTVSEVLAEVGYPTGKMAFNGVHTGWEEWIYPTGSIFFYRLIAKKVVLRSSDSPAPKQISDRADWPVAVGDEFDDIAPAEKFGDF